MTTYSLPTNITGPVGLLQYETGQLTSLAPMFMLFIFLIVMGAGAYNSQRLSGRSRISMWGTIAGLITFTIGSILFLYDNVINITTLVIILSVTLMFAAVFFFTKTD